MEKIEFTGNTPEELRAAVAAWLALQLANTGNPQPTTQGGDGGGPG